MTKQVLWAVLALAFSSSVSFALEAHVSKVTAATPARAWDAVGDFCGISTWHPQVKACHITEVMGAKLRMITLKDGGKIREQLVEQNNDAMIQRSLFLDGALPVSNYQATLKVAVTDGGTAYIWSGNFEAASVTDAAAVQSLTDFYRVGLEALADVSQR